MREGNSTPSWFVVAVVIVAVLPSLFGCSTSATSAIENDPFEPTNRVIFESSQKIDRAAIKPAAEAYRRIMPTFAREVLHNILVNLDCPVVFANDWLQGAPVEAKQTFLRCAANSTLGMTLARWGLGEGPYLFMPLLGPSNPRDLTGAVVDVAFQPEVYASFRYKAYWELGRFGLEYFDARARNIETVNYIERSSVDLYAAERSVYRQRRSIEISPGKQLPDF
jgi:phospholipid-binding lipoprotein MlaA